MENADSVLPEHPTDTARALTEGPAFRDGYRSVKERAGRDAPSRENPHPEPERPTPTDPHVRFQFGRNRAIAEKRRRERPERSTNGPVLSRHKVSEDRWFWIVGGDWHMVHFRFHGVDLLWHGFQPTAEEAVRAAQDIYPGAEPKEGKLASYAKQYWDMLKARKRQARESPASSSRRMEFVYAVRSLPGGKSLEKHRRIKTTPKRIFIARERWGLEKGRSGNWRDYDVRRLALSREEMEAQGFVERRSGDAQTRYFLNYEDAAAEAGGAAPQECLHVLGLEAGATEEKVKEAFRARSKEVHPDHGGDAAAFRRLRDAYEEALKAVQR